MKLNENTLSVLKNFASIQLNLVFNEGKTLKTIADAKNVMSVAELDQEIPQNFGVHDLNEFLSVLSLVDDPELSFKDKFVTISDSTGRSSVKYYFADTSLLTTATKDIPMPEAEVRFTLDEGTLNKIRRATSALGHEKMTIAPADGCLKLSVVDPSNATSSCFSIDVPGSYDSENFNFVMNISNLKLISGDYDVEISSKLLSKFTNKTSNVKYFIALEKSSTYGA
jgi:hypothetical protein